MTCSPPGPWQLSQVRDSSSVRGFATKRARVRGAVPVRRLHAVAAPTQRVADVLGRGARRCRRLVRRQRARQHEAARPRPAAATSPARIPSRGAILRLRLRSPAARCARLRRLRLARASADGVAPCGSQALTRRRIRRSARRRPVRRGPAPRSGTSPATRKCVGELDFVVRLAAGGAGIGCDVPSRAASISAAAIETVPTGAGA